MSPIEHPERPPGGFDEIEPTVVVSERTKRDHSEDALVHVFGHQREKRDGARIAHTMMAGMNVFLLPTVQTSQPRDIKQRERIRSWIRLAKNLRTQIHH